MPLSKSQKKLQQITKIQQQAYRSGPSRENAFAQNSHKVEKDKQSMNLDLMQNKLK